MKPLVSVIVPVYNAEVYLKPCIDSLIKQTMRDIEIILINDGSTDGSGSICDTYAREDSRILVIHKENEGVSATRNAGIDAAGSDYIVFVDSDDWVDSGFCEALYNIAVTNRCDIILSNHNFMKNGKLMKQSNPGIPEGLVSRETAMDLIHAATPGCYSWDLFCHKDLWKNIRFPSGRLCEDIATTYKLVHNASRIYYNPHSLYYYRFGRPGSLSNSQSMNFAVDYIDMSCMKNADLKSWGYDDRYEKKLALIALAYFGHMNNLTDRFVPVVKGIDGYPDYLNSKEKFILFVYRRSVPLFNIICTMALRRQKGKS